MSLYGALNIGRSALAAQQAALQVTGNNIANAGNADYTRETATVSPSPDQQVGPGIFLGTGVNLTGVQRQIDQSLQARLRSASSDQQAAQTSQTFLSRVETSFNALGTSNLSTHLATFFTSWSNLANSPQDSGVRQVVLQDGSDAAQAISSQRSQLTGIQSDVQTELSAQAQTADGLAQQVADLNGQIVVSSGGSAGSNNSLLDQRDAVLKKLSNLVNIQTVQQSDGSMNVYVASEPLVVDGKSNGITVTQQTVNNEPVSTVVFKSTGGPLNPTSGELSALESAQTQVADVTSQLDTLAHNLIGAVNQIHSSGQGTEGFTSVTSAAPVKDATAPLNSATAGLSAAPSNGSFVVHVTNKTTGLSTSTLVQVNLNGSPSDTTLNSLSGSLGAINGVTSTVANGQLTVSATSGNTITFSQDSSGALAGLGINTFFTGTDASDIAVNQALVKQPTLIAAAKNGSLGDNQTALSIAALNTGAMDGKGGPSVQDSFQTIITGVSGQVASANTNAQASKAVTDTLTAQQQSLSGVSLDEESINMLTQQRTYQGAAMFITTLNHMMDTLLAIAT